MGYAWTDRQWLAVEVYMYPACVPICPLDGEMGMEDHVMSCP